MGQLFSDMNLEGIRSNLTKAEKSLKNIQIDEYFNWLPFVKLTEKMLEEKIVYDKAFINEIIGPDLSRWTTVYCDDRFAVAIRWGNEVIVAYKSFPSFTQILSYIAIFPVLPIMMLMGKNIIQRSYKGVVRISSGLNMSEKGVKWLSRKIANFEFQDLYASMGEVYKSKVEQKCQLVDKNTADIELISFM